MEKINENENRLDGEFDNENNDDNNEDKFLFESVFPQNNKKSFENEKKIENVFDYFNDNIKQDNNDNSNNNNNNDDTYFKSIDISVNKKDSNNNNKFDIEVNEAIAEENEQSSNVLNIQKEIDEKAEEVNLNELKPNQMIDNGN